jgi:hypothetical protein
MQKSNAVSVENMLQLLPYIVGQYKTGTNFSKLTSPFIILLYYDMASLLRASSRQH